MEPVPVTRAVRRTVRVAVALVVGQALLCALIGWLTFGPAPPRHAAKPPVDQLAARPIGKPMPTEEGVLVLSLPPPPKPEAPVDRPRSPVPSTSVGPSAPATSAPPAAPPSPPGTVPPAPPSGSPVIAPAPSGSGTSPGLAPPPSGSGTSPGLAPSPSDPAVTERIRRSVTLGERCRPEGALGETRWGTTVRCLRDGRYRPRWKIV